MPTFKITGPDGKKYRVTGDNADGALQALQETLGDAQQPMVDPSTNQPPGVPEFRPPGVEGYNPQTGNVEPSRMKSAGFGAADIGSMAFGDEIGAGIMSGAGKMGLLPGGDQPSYEQILSQMRGADTQAKEVNPGSYLAGQVGGGVTQALAGGLPAFLKGGASLLGKTLAGMGVGGASGVAHGAGTGEDMQSRMGNALVEGGIGTVVGGALPVLGVGAANLYGSARDALTKNMPAGLDVMRLLSSAIDPAGGKQAIAAAGPDAMLADAGPNARALLDQAIQRGGPGGQKARDAIEARAGRAGDRVTSALDQTMGAPQGVETTRKAIREGSASARGSAYDTAYATPIDYASPKGMAIEEIVKTRVPKSAIDAANELMRTEGAKSKQILAKVGDDGSVTLETLPDVRQLDYITRGLNEVADAADAKGKMGGTTAQGRAYSNLARELRSNMKDAVPEYGTALETAADPISRAKAVKFGSTILSPSTTREEVAEFADGLTGPERKAALQGIRSQIDDTIANVTRTVQDPNTDAREAIKALKDLSSRASRSKIAAIVDDPKVADDLFQQLDEAAHSFDLRAATTENSKTYARTALDKRARDLNAPGVVGNAMDLSPVKASQALAKTLTGRTPEAMEKRDADFYRRMVDALLSPGGGMISGVEQMGKRDLATQLMQERLANLLTGGVRPGSALVGSEARQRLDRR